MSLQTRASGGGAAAAGNEVVKPALSQAVGYIVVVLIGLIVAFSARNLAALTSGDADMSSHDFYHQAPEADCRRGQQED